MKIGVLSDSHDHLTHIQAVLAVFRREGITVLIHCGDMTTVETGEAFGEFRVIHSIGNCDYASAEIRQALQRQNPQSFSAPVYTGEIDGVPFAVVHGHQTTQTRELIQSNLYRYVFYGHTHLRHDETIGTCRLINPGALGGRKPQEYSAFIIDLSSGASRFHIL